MKSSMALPPSRSESGFALIEAIVSAAVLAMVALAVLSGVAAGNRSSAREKARAVAASLAEQDQERMRAMTVETLLAVPQVGGISVDGATYNIKSEAVLVTDAKGGTPACGSTATSSEYIHITTTVTSTIVGKRIPPVKIDSLVSPSVAYSQSHGSLGVQILDRNGKGVANLAVAATGASVLTTQNTDQQGCVIWREIPIGNYTITVDKSGWGLTDGTPSPISKAGTVSPNTVSFVKLGLDALRTAPVTIKTHSPGQNFVVAQTVASKARSITDVSALSGDHIKRTWTPGGFAGTINATNLFPFPTTSYAFFTGACDYESPFKLITNYGNLNANALLIADPTTTPNPQATVYQPPVNMRVLRKWASSGTVAPNPGDVYVYFTPQPGTSECTDEAAYRYTTMTWPTGWGTGRPTDANSTGYVSQTTSSFDPGLPFGKYTVCLQDVASSKVYKPTGASGTYDNTTADSNKNLSTYTYSPTNGSWVTGSC
jgi:type II secretory pathway pseudopilin PulG